MRRSKDFAATPVQEWTDARFRTTRKSWAGICKKLWERVKSGKYRALPLRRVYIPKEDGKSERPISIPALEDKIVQAATVRLLNAVYEVDFLDCSYGSRPGRDAHQALDEVDRVLFRESITHVLELDIKSYFDSIVRKLLVEMIERRVSDGSILRLIGKWLNVGVIDEGRRLETEDGVGQGQVVSPFLANIYLHHVLDQWFEDEVKPRLIGKAFLVRYVDDAPQPVSFATTIRPLAAHCSCAKQLGQAAHCTGQTSGESRGRCVNGWWKSWLMRDGGRN